MFDFYYLIFIHNLYNSIGRGASLTGVPGSFAAYLSSWSLEPKIAIAMQ